MTNQIQISKIEAIRNGRNNILVVGNHPQIVQSILDFDYLAGKSKPSIFGIIGNSDAHLKYFWGKKEVLISQYHTFERVENAHLIDWFINLSSGRRALSTGIVMNRLFTNLTGGVFFAEGVPELHSLELYNTVVKNGRLLIGPASVGLVLPGILKLGPIGGITPEQIVTSGILEQGDVAVMSASGGMTNELISVVLQSGHHLSFSLSFGGDRFPLLTPKNAFALALEDPKTKTIVYYGELGGTDEYELIDILNKNSKHEARNPKKVIAHIAGTVADLFSESPQFGHAKAKAETVGEKARQKREALKKAGVIVTESFGELGKVLRELRI
ncbi:MAG: hypothetical protein WC775_05140 [Patescibacteria group bacterium]|jgi:ATP citrate (pro-S)-lyase